MQSGMNCSLLKVDGKGRLHLPMPIRKRFNIKREVVAEIRKKELIIKPVKHIDNPIGFLSSINVKTKKTPVEMKREAESGFYL